MRLVHALLVVVLWVTLASPALATPDAVADREIRHLLDFVSASACTFIRNGDPHPSKEAAEHLLMKYERARSRLATAEQFIDKVASGSYLTGREYRVQCAGRAEMATADWLRAELAAARAAAEGGTAGQ
jgi:hypothetical protein